MALVTKDRVKETTTTTGTGTVTLGGAVSGFQSFSAIGDGNTTYYAIVLATAGEWEIGLGTYTASGTTLSRDTVLESSNSGSLVNFSSGSKEVFCTYPAEKAAFSDDIPTNNNELTNGAGYITGNQTITLSGDATGSGTTSISVSLAADSVGASEIAANAVGASELNVTGNGTASQFLRSDGDGTFTWATPTDTNTTYTAGTGLSLSGTTFSNSAPDQTVTLTGSGATTISGTYPNFTISSTDTNTTYSAGTNISLSGTTFNVDDAFVLNTGDTMTGTLTMGYNGSGYSNTISLQGASGSTGEVGLRAYGESFQIYEPEDGNKVWLEIADDPSGNNTALKVNSSGGMQTVWHAGNDGSGSGLDADLLDGQHGSYYSASTHNHTLDSLSNTTITSNTSGEILKWNGSAWVNNTLAEAGIQPSGSYLTGNQTITLSGDVSGSGTTSITCTVANDSHTHDGRYYTETESDARFLRSDADDTTTGTISINNINKSLRVGDITGDNYVEIKQTNANGYGFTYQYTNASICLNQQGTTNEVLVLGDTTDSNTLLGVGISSDGGSSWTKRLNLTGQGDLYIGSSGTTKVATESYVDTQISGLGATTFPFYKEDGSSDTIAITNGSFPFYKADGSQDNIGVS